MIILTLSPNERYYIKLKASYLYYKENKTQTEIAELFNISRPTLIKLLNDAKQEGIVTIEIHDLLKTTPYFSLEQDLCEKLNIRDVKIVDIDTRLPEIVNMAIGEVAQQYLVNLLKPGMKVGVGWGRTLEGMIRYFKPDPSLHDLDFISLLGSHSSSNATDYSMFANSLCEAMASNFANSSISVVYAPLVAQNETIAQTFLASDIVATAYQKHEALNIAIVGIDGDPCHSTTIETEKVFQPLLPEIKKIDAVGNICTRFYDADGIIHPLSVDGNIISISAANLRKTPVVIGAAGGQYKAASILGGARARLFNILITDVHTARDIIDL